MKTPRHLAVTPNPCSTCPYRRDTPPGIWEPEEYERMRESGERFATFLCHHSPVIGKTICRGWLTVERDSIAVRLAIFRGEVTAAERDAPVSAALYETGHEGADAGLAGVDHPSPAARKAIAALIRRR